MNKLLKLALILLLFTFSFFKTFGQLSNFSFQLLKPKKDTLTALGWNGLSSTYNPSTSYTIYSGDRLGTDTGFNLVMTSFERNSEVYEPFILPNGNIYSRVRVNRVISNSHSSSPAPIQDLNKQVLFFQNGGSSGNNLFLTSSYTNVQEAINSRIVNRGGDNVFTNSNSEEISSNVERIDLIFQSGVSTNDVTKSGFIINERGGNDNFKVAAILSLDGSGNPSNFGSLFNITTSDWTSTGQSMTSVVFQRNGSDNVMRPSHNVVNQSISSVFVTLDNLGISNNAVIYGFALFPNDVTSSMNLVSLNNVPLNTNGGTNGGLDIMGGGGFFRASGVTFTLLPVTFSNISLDVNNQVARVKWSTSHENNNNHFVVERSFDGENFEEIGTVNGIGHSYTTQHYQFLDVSVTSKIVFYRIKQVDLDGSFEYSRIVRGQINQLIPKDMLKIYPNPTSNEFFISNSINSIGTIRIFDFKGSEVFRTQSEESIIKISTVEFEKGLYIIQTENNEQYKLIVE
jgi:hypothetical protein